MKFEKLKYKCPSCRQETLMIDAVGFIICSLLGCKEPDAFHKTVMMLEKDRDQQQI